MPDLQWTDLHKPTDQEHQQQIIKSSTQTNAHNLRPGRAVIHNNLFSQNSCSSFRWVTFPQLMLSTTSETQSISITIDYAKRKKRKNPGNKCKCQENYKLMFIHIAEQNSCDG